MTYPSRRRKAEIHAAEIERLRYALEAMLTLYGMDEMPTGVSRLTHDQARAALLEKQP